MPSVLPPYDKLLFGLSGVMYARVGVEPDETHPVVRLWGDGIQLLTSYYYLSTSCDGAAAGVLADWLDDNFDDCVKQIHEKVRHRVRSHIDTLRIAFHNPHRNHSGADN